jgi:hypothetical protein
MYQREEHQQEQRWRLGRIRWDTWTHDAELTWRVPYLQETKWWKEKDRNQRSDGIIQSTYTTWSVITYTNQEGHKPSHLGCVRIEDWGGELRVSTDIVVTMKQESNILIPLL